MADVYDVAVIGAGVVGAAVARELAQYDLRCILIEAGEDVGAATSKANTAILHTGFDGKPSYLETRMVKRGNQLLNAYSAEVGIPIERLGALLVAWDQDQLDALAHIVEVAHENGSPDVGQISVDELYRREPHIGQGALGAIEVPREAIICPFTPPLAYATQAVINGVTLRLNSPVTSIERTPEGDYRLACPNETITCRYLVNAAGLYSDVINRMLGYDEFGVIPRRGQLIVFDKMARGLVNHILLPVPTKMGKGVLISPTVFGNVMLGPTAENLNDKTATETTADGIAMLLDKGRRILPSLLDEEVTAMYSGLRASTQHDDLQIYLHEEARYLCLGGIRSTGLSGSMAIAEYALDLLGQAGLKQQRKAEFKSIQMPNLGEAFPRPYQSDDLIHQNPDYGRIVCHCERVTRGEILDALHTPIPACSPDSLRRRTRAQMGRCQGFYCAAEVSALLASKEARS
ncbi:MAG TPA: NAD(P)/FAD-dependent oxidoreductase [Phototrophicaceae bacterium]|nr:NAD(P)/FAD-dependent oxidoreductase [Phototrophicaceae bacterium]